MDLVSGLSAASTAISIAKDLREIDRSVDEASYKLKLAELTSALADTKLALADAKSRIKELDEELSSLRSGPSCPVCGHRSLSVRETRMAAWSGFQMHVVVCDFENCAYTTERLYDASIGRYVSSRPNK